MKNPFKKSPAAGLEAALANLAARRDTLEARKADAVAKLDAARSARKNALASDTGADLTPLTRAVRDCEDEIETLDGVLADLVEQVAHHERQLADARDADQRAAAAKTLDGIGNKVAAAATSLDEALRQVGVAYVELVNAVPATLGVVQMDTILSPHYGQTPMPVGLHRVERAYEAASPNDLARAILAEGLAYACPSAFGLSGPWGDYRVSLERAADLAGDRPSFSIRTSDAMSVAVSACGAATALITDRLKERAQGILAGHGSVDLADRTPYQAPELPPPPPPEVQAYVSKPFCYRLKPGEMQKIVNERWVSLLPISVADAAVAAGVALRTDTPEGAAAFEAERERRRGSQQIVFRNMTTFDDCLDLGTILQPEASADVKEAA